MNKFQVKASSTMIILSGAIALGAQSHNAPDNAEMIKEMAQTISDNYVFPEMGAQASAMLLSNLASGKYADLDPMQLAQRLGADLQALTHDRHFGVRVLPPDFEPPSNDEQDGEDETEGDIETDDDAQIMAGPTAPFGFNRVERLSGNIGYIELSGFVQAPYIAETLEATMQLVQGASAIIFDLRTNGGGDPATVQLISSYFFDPDQPAHLNSLYYRPTDTTTEYWTHSDINTKLAMPEVPMYVLTSNYTFSAAEEFTYNLKNLKRATIVGQTTGGGAHPVNSFFFDNTLMAIVPIARAINPISGTNWEGTGVTPDIQVSADEALDTVLLSVFETAIKAGNESMKFGYAQIQARLHPMTCTPQELDAYAGDYGSRHIQRVGDTLNYRRDGVGDWRRIICFAKDQFVIEGSDGFIMHFDRDESGTITQIRGLYEQGHQDVSARD